MKRAAIAILLSAWPVVAHADFHQIVRTIERSTGIRRTYIPLLGMARFFVRLIEPEGVSDIRIAVFEGKSRDLPSNFDEAIRAAVGPEFQPVVTVASKREGERALIFAKPTRRGMRMIIVAHEHGEAAVVELEVDPKRFARFVEQARHGHPTFRW